LLAALAHARPWQPAPGGGVQPFATVADVRRAAAALTRLALRIAIAEQGLGVDLAALAHAPEPRPALDDCARTALARALGGGAAEPSPLSPGEIPRDFGPEARARAAAALRARLDAAGVSAGREYLDALVDSWLSELRTALAELPARPDPRFVAGVLLRGTPS
jgi:hypothetical protein